MFAGMIVGAALVVAVLLLSSSAVQVFSGKRQYLGLSIVGLLIAGATGAIVIGFSQDASDEQLPNSGLSLAEIAQASSMLQGTDPNSASVRRVASVPSLIDGLKVRLEADPSNASGWALLAQSYAFVGDAEQSEFALSKAVELGLSEADLRQRVDGARREPHADLGVRW